MKVFLQMAFTLALALALRGESASPVDSDVAGKLLHVQKSIANLSTDNFYPGSCFIKKNKEELEAFKKLFAQLDSSCNMESVKALLGKPTSETSEAVKRTGEFKVYILKYYFVQHKEKSANALKDVYVSFRFFKDGKLQDVFVSGSSRQGKPEKSKTAEQMGDNADIMR